MNDPERYQKKLKYKSEWGKKPKYWMYVIYGLLIICGVFIKKL